MNSARSDFLHVARERGYIHQTTEEGAFLARLQAGPLSGYIGFDATADSLHVGSLVQIMLLRLMQRTGNRPVVLMGGGTTKVGDPSFRDEARPLLSDAQIETNKAGIRKVFDAFLTFGDGPTDAIMLDNAEWLDRLLYIPFLRDVGRHFSVNRMLTMESVKQRLERDQPLTFLEFNYMLLQAYDFLELRRRHGVVLQMGGSDQWGNIVMGTDLIRRMDQAEAFGLTTPLITTASGAKMGKTARGAVWLNADRVSPYDYWQFWRDTEGTDVARFMGLFTELPMAEIARYAALQGAEVNEAKKVLATEACALLHGRAAAEAAAETARKAFEEGLNAPGLPTVVSVLPSPIIDVLVEHKLVPSKGEARRLIANSGIYANNLTVTATDFVLTVDDLQDGVIRLSIGKKRHVLLKPE